MATVTLNLTIEVRSRDPEIHRNAAKILVEKTDFAVQQFVVWNVDDYDTRAVTVIDTLIKVPLVQAQSTKSLQIDACIDVANKFVHALRCTSEKPVAIAVETASQRYSLGTCRGFNYGEDHDA